jgi:hypothetical protein
MMEATAMMALGIGKPDLRYVHFRYDRMQRVLTQMGIPPKTTAVLHRDVQSQYHGNTPTV